MEAGRISTGMTEKKRTLLDIDPADRARLLASATAYAAGRRTYVVGAVSDVIAANAGRLDAAAREALADAALAVRLGERLRELQSNSGVLDRMFTGFSDRLPNGERADTGWAPPTSTAVMDDGLRERMRRAIGAWTWQEFLDAVYKLGLFRED